MTKALWDFALERYQYPGVAATCLRLQDDAGADVNMLLTAAWLAERGYCWNGEQVRALIARCAEWRERCIVPLRAVRRYLEPHGLYAQAKALELDAEIHQLHILQDALRPMTFSGSDTSPPQRLAANFQIYFECIDGERPSHVDADRAALVAALS